MNTESTAAVSDGHNLNNVSDGQRAVRTLLASKLIHNLKEVADQETPVGEGGQASEEHEMGETSEKDDKDGQSGLHLRFSLPLTSGLVQRLIAIPLLPTYLKTALHNNKRSDHYELSCASDQLGIWHASDVAIQVLNKFSFETQSARVELPFFLLWALHAVVPGVCQVLQGDVFGPAQDPVRNTLKPLPEPIPYDLREPSFEFNYGLMFGKASIHPTELVHTFITGATGVGKTYGAVKPLLQSFLGYKNAAGQSMGLLVIDPKAELLQVCVTQLRQAGQSPRLFRLGSGQKIKFFTDSCELGLEDRYRTLASMVQIKTAGDSSIWQEKGNRLNIDMATLDRRFQLQTGYLLWGVVRSLLEGQDHTQGSQWDNIQAIYKHAVATRVNIEWLAAVSNGLLGLCPGLQGLKSVFAVYISDAELLNQLYYRVSNAEQICKDLSSQEVVRVISTDLYPRAQGDDVSIEDLVAQAKVILHQPSSSHFGDITGRLVKSRFFADVLARKDMLQPVGFVVDEFQRYITSDRDTGEQSFLDRCRAYRVNCVLASQSLASIELALLQTGETAPRLAVEILVANSPTKIIYRSLDSSTHRSLKEWIPPAPEGRRHVVDIRPPAQLQLGCAYYLCNGHWGLYKYEKTA